MEKGDPKESKGQDGDKGKKLSFTDMKKSVTSTVRNLVHKNDQACASQSSPSTSIAPINCKWRWQVIRDTYSEPSTTIGYSDELFATKAEASREARGWLITWWGEHKEQCCVVLEQVLIPYIQ